MKRKRVRVRVRVSESESERKIIVSSKLKTPQNLHFPQIGKVQTTIIIFINIIIGTDLDEAHARLSHITPSCHNQVCPNHASDHFSIITIASKSSLLTGQTLGSRNEHRYQVFLPLLLVDGGC